MLHHYNNFPQQKGQTFKQLSTRIISIDVPRVWDEIRILAFLKTKHFLIFEKQYHEKM